MQTRRHFLRSARAFGCAMTTLVYSTAEVDALIAGVGSGGPPQPGGSIWKNIVTDYGAVGNGIADDSPAFAAAIADINSGTINRLYVPTLPGAGPNNPTKYRIASQLPTIQSQAFKLTGDGMWETQIIRDYNGTNGVGCLDIRGAAIGVEIDGITIASAAGRTGGHAIQFQADAGAGYAGSQTSLRNVNLTSYGSNSWDQTLRFNGTLKTIDPKGWRTVSLNNVLVFGANGYSVQFSAVVGLTWFGGGVFAASGTSPQSGAVLITGTPTVPTSSVVIQVESCNGLVLNNCQYGIIESPIIGNINGVSVAADNTCDRFWVRGFRTGSASLTWTNSWLNP